MSDLGLPEALADYEAIALSVISRFWRFVERSPGCWHWHGSKAHGYGRMFIDGTWVQAHRISWMIHRGQIPQGSCILHHCDNPPCVNPDHLFTGTYQDNSNDMKSKGRQRSLTGEAHPRALLSERAVREIKKLLGSETQSAIAQSFNVRRQVIHDIAKGKTWRHLT